MYLQAVCQRSEFLGDGPAKCPSIPAREVRTPDTTSEQRVSGEKMTMAEETYAARGVTWGMQDLELNLAHFHDIPIVQLASRRRSRTPHPEQGSPGSGLARDPGRVGHVDLQHPPGGGHHLTCGSQMVEVTVSEHHGIHRPSTQSLQDHVRLVRRIHQQDRTTRIV